MSDKLREAFERDVCKRYELKTDFVEGVGYTNVATVVAWEGFQAGHAHAMRGEKRYTAEVAIEATGKWRCLNSIAYDNIDEAKKAAATHRRLVGAGLSRIVTYIRQEEE